MARVVLSKNFDPNNVVFASKINPMNDAVTSCKISYRYPEETINGTKFPGETSRLIIQSAKMKAPYGMKNGERFGQPDKWAVNLSFQDEEKKKSIASFRTAYEALDIRVIQEGLARTDLGGNHDFDDDDDEELRKKLIKKGYSSRIQIPKNTGENDYPTTLRLDVPWDREKQTPRDYVQFYDENNELTSWETAQTTGLDMVCLFEVNQVWTSVGNHKFGISIKLIQMKIYGRGTSGGKVTSFQIQNEVEDDDEVESESESIDADAIEEEVDIDDLSE